MTIDNRPLPLLTDRKETVAQSLSPAGGSGEERAEGGFYPSQYKNHPRQSFALTAPASGGHVLALLFPRLNSTKARGAQY